MRETTQRQGSHTLCNLLLAGFRWFDTALLNALHRAGYEGIRRPHSLAFAHLDRVGSARISELARMMGVTRQSAHQTVQELRDMGLVELRPDPTNASALLVAPSTEGRRSIRIARRRYDDLERELARRIGEASYNGLRRALEMDWGDPPR